ncbi:MAG: TonB-dependent receptor [Bacteroidales bacterium]|nr:TonB-dependent receptor [Bacteroidales bacterium]
MKHFAIIVLTIVTLSNAVSQTGGKLLDAVSGEAIVGAVVKAGNEQTVTNTKGEFYLTSRDIDSIEVRHISYGINKLIVPLNSTGLIIRIDPISNKLSEIKVQTPLSEYSLNTFPGSLYSFQFSDHPTVKSISIAEYLNEAPGVYVHQGTNSTNRLTIRGVGSRTPYSTNRIKVFVNNIPITNLDGVTAIEDIEPSVVSSLDIIKGPKSVLYGAGLGGAIVADTKHTSDNRYSAMAGYQYGSFNTQKLKARIAYKFGNSDAWIYSSVFNSDGYRENNRQTRYSAGGGYQYSTNKHSLNILALYTSLSAGIPSSLNDSMFHSSRASAAPNWLGVKGGEKYRKLISGINSEYKITSRVQNEFTFFANLQQGDEKRPFNILSDKSVHLGVKEGLKFKFGRFGVQNRYEFQWENYKWSLFDPGFVGKTGANQFVSRRSQFNSLFFVQYAFNNWQIEGGLNGNITSYQLINRKEAEHDYSNYSYKPILSPLIGLNYKPINQMSIYATVGHGFSHPSSEETLISNGGVNTSLKPEQGYTYEVGLRYFSNSTIFLDVGYFYLSLNDLLVTKRESESVFYGINAGKTTHTGVEFHLKSIFIQKFKIDDYLIGLQLNGAYGLYKFNEFEDDGNVYNGNSLPGVPRYSLNTIIDINLFNSLKLRTQYERHGKQFLDDDNTMEYGAYDLVQLKILYHTTFYNQHKFEFNMGVYNALNKSYASMLLINAPSFGGDNPRYYYPGLPRNYSLGLIYSL